MIGTGRVEVREAAIVGILDLVHLAAVDADVIAALVVGLAFLGYCEVEADAAG